MPEGEMLAFRNFGKKSLTEIRQKLDEMELALGMNLDAYGITRENIKEIDTHYRAEKQQGAAETHGRAEKQQGAVE